MGAADAAEDDDATSGQVVDARPRVRSCPIPIWAAVDWVTSLLVLAPLCVLYWWSTWKLMDVYVLRGRTDASGLVSAVLGHVICWACNASQRWLTAFLTDGQVARWWRGVVARLYTALFAFGLVNEWRGVWLLLDFHFGKSSASGAGSTSIGIAALAVGRALRNVLAPPLGLSTDCLDHTYAYSPTRFRTLQAKKPVGLFLLDVTFSVVVVGSLVVFVWRGVWTLLDGFLFPDSPQWSCGSSLAIGYGIVLLSYALQYPAASVSRRFDTDIWRILWEDAFLLIASFGGINVWRGIWLVADLYIYPDNPVLSSWLTHAVGMLGSILLFAGNTILARGVFLDGEFKDGSGCIFNTLYLRRFLHSKRCQKEQNESGVVDMRVVNSMSMRKDKANGRACNQTLVLDDSKGMLDGSVNNEPGQRTLLGAIEKESMV